MMNYRMARWKARTLYPSFRWHIYEAEYEAAIKCLTTAKPDPAAEQHAYHVAKIFGVSCPDLIVAAVAMDFPVRETDDSIYIGIEIEPGVVDGSFHHNH